MLKLLVYPFLFTLLKKDSGTRLVFVHTLILEVEVTLSNVWYGLVHFFKFHFFVPFCIYIKNIGPLINK